MSLASCRFCGRRRQTAATRLEAWARLVRRYRRLACVRRVWGLLGQKLKEIKDMTSGLKARVREQRDRPEAMEALKNMVNTSQTFYGKAVNSTSVVDGYFTQDELDGET